VVRKDSICFPALTCCITNIKDICGASSDTLVSAGFHYLNIVNALQAMKITGMLPAISQTVNCQSNLCGNKGLGEIHILSGHHYSHRIIPVKRYSLVHKLKC